jgi:hypothetical protein
MEQYATIARRYKNIDRMNGYLFIKAGENVVNARVE